jgi:hypothetical protein
VDGCLILAMELGMPRDQYIQYIESEETES